MSSFLLRLVTAAFLSRVGLGWARHTHKKNGAKDCPERSDDFRARATPLVELLSIEALAPASLPLGHRRNTVWASTAELLRDAEGRVEVGVGELVLVGGVAAVAAAGRRWHWHTGKQRFERSGKGARRSLAVLRPNTPPLWSHCIPEQYRRSFVRFLEHSWVLGTEPPN